MKKSALFFVFLPLIATALKCHYYTSTVDVSVEPEEQVKECNATQFCGRLDAGNKLYHDVTYFCDAITKCNCDWKQKKMSS